VHTKAAMALTKRVAHMKPRCVRACVISLTAVSPTAIGAEALVHGLLLAHGCVFDAAGVPPAGESYVSVWRTSAAAAATTAASTTAAATAATAATSAGGAGVVTAAASASFAVDAVDTVADLGPLGPAAALDVVVVVVNNGVVVAVVLSGCLPHVHVLPQNHSLPRKA